MTKSAVYSEAGYGTAPGITLLVQQVGLQLEIAQGSPARRYRRQVRQYRQQLAAVAQGRVAKSNPLALKVFRLQRQVEKFSTLPADWDTYGAEPTQPAAIRQAQRILHGLSLRLPGSPSTSLHVFPMRDGGVQLDVDRAGRAMEVEVHPDGTADYLVFTPAGELLATHTSLTAACEQFADSTQLLPVN